MMVSFLSKFWKSKSDKRFLRLHLMTYFNRQTRILIRNPSPMVTLYYVELFPLVQIQIQIPLGMVSQMVTVPILGTDLHPMDLSPTQFYYISNRGS